METKQDKRGHGKVTGKLLHKGNMKIDKSCGIFSLPAVTTCMSLCKNTCAKSCYALNASTRFEHTRNARAYNLHIIKTKYKFIRQMCKEIEKNKFKTIRIHESGDFALKGVANIDYINKWKKIIELNPNVKFYGYTKCKESLVLNDLPNCNIIYSFVNGFKNFGSIEYVTELQNRYGCHICNLDESKGEKCMRDCTKCVNKDCKSVAFIEHGNLIKYK